MSIILLINYSLITSLVCACVCVCIVTINFIYLSSLLCIDLV